MARPNKQGLDYFPLDVHLCKKFKFIEMKYGIAGFSIVVKLYQYIYANGYYVDWDDDTCLLFSDDIKADYSMVLDVIKECLARGIFDKTLFDKYSILTSSGIQKRYQEIVRRRKDVEVISEYLLIDGSFGVIVDTMSAECKYDESKSTQSKVNKSKVNKIKEYTPEFEEFWKYYPRKNEKKAAYEKWNARLKEGHTPEELIKSAKHYLKACQGKEKQFIKHGKTFLGDKKPFEDYIEPPEIEEDLPSYWQIKPRSDPEEKSEEDLPYPGLEEGFKRLYGKFGGH
ncbi:DUF4373 domain-containing protein [Candidatus Contubernalis alkaliaceticus]|uniref:DUF4373 domain-containing protein n=1 Tax=Candidatus Contubernalis alkaliaceticus TaxID=338645 RepID=UPI001F4C201E|nr:DUF4373 domain-containing protein [Candidatus Contubernalis alkalaceticus]UNC91669.1 DUF4373 domain-containing protein [Candidatus Contubernalis alkalaceticus]